MAVERAIGGTGGREKGGCGEEEGAVPGGGVLVRKPPELAGKRLTREI